MFCQSPHLPTMSMQRAEPIPPSHRIGSGAMLIFDPRYRRCLMIIIRFMVSAKFGVSFGAKVPMLRGAQWNG